MKATSTDRDHYDALAVVSPSRAGGEIKDQDRVRWFPTLGIASLADGVTSSPFGGEAADLATSLSPTLFGGDPRDRLGTLADLLAARRVEAQHAPLNVAPGTSASIQQMVREAAQDRMKSAYQTTLVAVAFTPTDDGHCLTTLCCGDSGFFAFGEAGELLACSLGQQSAHQEAEVRTSTDSDAGALHFGPGDEMLVKIIGSATEYALYAQMAGVEPRFASQWLACVALDIPCSTSATGEQLRQTRAFVLHKGGVLLVPCYLVGNHEVATDAPYRRIRFSTTMRPVSDTESVSPAIGFSNTSPVTAVLPDHFLSGRWSYAQDRFPAEAQFVLASDGFYGAFDDAAELWAWLHTNRSALDDPSTRDRAMQGLHARLDAKSGDYDISFVWVKSKAPPRDLGVEDHCAGGEEHAG